MALVVQSQKPALVPVAGTADSFPVGRIWCVGRNYADHAREMGHDDRDPPFFFAKPASAVALDGSELPFPPQTKDLHHEVELVVALAGGGSDVTVEQAHGLVFGYAVGFDMTLRDVQGLAKKAGRPWDLSKGFDRSCPIGPIAPAARIGHPLRGRIEATVNGEVRQHGDIDQMIWSVAECIACLSRSIELLPGDLLMTGTPAGVGSVQAGDWLRGRCDGVGEVSVTYRA